jgi:hypothetical protein
MDPGRRFVSLVEFRLNIGETDSGERVDLVDVDVVRFLGICEA